MLLDGNLSLEEAEGLIHRILDGDLSPQETYDTLTAWNRKGSTDPEIRGAYTALRKRMRRVTITKPAIDICGTGGDGYRTMNISTGTAIVLAAAGFPVAKYGNRSLSSPCGATDVLEKLGMNINLSPEATVQCLNATGFAFFPANQYHDLERITPILREIGGASIFKRVLFLLHPAFPRRRILGLARPFREHMLAYQDILSEERVLGLTLCALDGMDEVSIQSGTLVQPIGRNDKGGYLLYPDHFGISQKTAEELAIQNPEEGADLLRRIFAGSETGTPLDALLVNTAVALLFLGRTSIRAGIEEAYLTIESGAALQKLEEVIAFTQRSQSE